VQQASRHTSEKVHLTEDGSYWLSSLQDARQVSLHKIALKAENIQFLVMSMHQFGQAGETFSHSAD